MKTESCREWREALGAYALGRVGAEERVKLEAHMEGCPGCKTEAASLIAVSRLLPHADPEHFGPAPAPPAELGKRIEAKIAAERRSGRQRRRLRLGFALGGVAAAAAAAVLAIFVLAGDDGRGPEQHVTFPALPPGVKIAATLEPQAFGTEIHMYVKGIRSGTLCQVFMRGAAGAVSAGTFRYRWGGDASAVLSAALDLSRARALVVHAGHRTFVAPLGAAETAVRNQLKEEEPT